jgi:hypothetical protein
MKMVCQLVIVIALVGLPVLAQERAQKTSANLTNSATLRDDTRLVVPVIEDAKPARDVIVKKNVELSGPLVKPFTVRKVTDVPRRLLQLINPFTPSERKEELESTRVVSARAWSTTVGWNPGGSAFSDAVTHEPSMSLISFSKTSRD